MNEQDQPKRAILSAAFFRDACTTSENNIPIDANIKTTQNNRQFNNFKIDGDIVIDAQRKIYLEISLNNVYANTIHLYGYMKTLIVGEESIIENIVIRGDGKIDNLLIAKNGKLNNLQIEDKAQACTFNIHDNGFVGDIRIHDSGQIKDLFFYDEATSNSITILSESRLGSFLLSQTSRLKKFNSLGNSILSSIILTDSSYIGELTSTSITKSINVTDNSSIEQLTITNRIGSLFINTKSTIPALTIHSVEVCKFLQLLDTSIGELTLRGAHKSSFNFSILSSSIDRMNVKDTLFKSESILRIHSSLFGSINFENTNNLGTIIMSSISVFTEFKSNNSDDVKSLFSLVNSSLGNTQFIECNLSDFKHFIFYNSKLLDSFLGGSTIPKFIQISLPKDRMKLEKQNDQKRLFYSQIKNIYERQGDVARAGEARAFEMQAYRQQLKLEKKAEYQRRENRNGESKKQNLWIIRKDQIVLLINEYSSNYGTNWLRAAMLTLVITIVSFEIYLALLGYSPGSDFQKGFELSSHTLSYLNPFRDEDTGQLMELVKEDVLTGYLEREWVSKKPIYYVPPFARLWDYISRILVAFMVYQTIAAFRRLGKSS